MNSLMPMNRRVICCVSILDLDCIIGSCYTADFIPQHLASTKGITPFIAIWAIFAVTQYYVLVFVNIITNLMPPFDFKDANYTIDLLTFYIMVELRALRYLADITLSMR